MTIKVQCACGTRFAFDVEPVKNRMPVRVNCPSCGADGTTAANEFIAQELAPPADPAPRIRITGTPPAIVAPREEAGPPTQEAGEATPAEVTAQEIEHCPKHRQEIAVEHCYVCGKPICVSCMQQFGYLCSVYCQSQAKQRNIPVPVFAGQKFVAEANEWRKVKLVSFGIAAGVVLLLGVYIWYITIGSKPRTLYTLATSKADRPVLPTLISPSEMVVLRSGKLALIDVEHGKELWSVALSNAKPAPAAFQKNSLFDFDDEPPAPKMQVIGDDIWVSLAGRIARFDRKTGKAKSEVPINGAIREIEFTPSSIVAVSEDPSRQRTVTRIELPSGNVRSDVVTAGLPARSPGAGTGQRTVAPVRPAGGDNEMSFDSFESPREFIAAGPNVAQVQSKLLERRMVAVQAMKTPQGTSTLNSGGLTARDSMKATMEELNNMQRESTGGISYENESRYQVTVRRFAPADAPDWNGEVVGPPAFFPQKTVDVLVAGKTIQAFSKKNQKLWEGKLTFPVAERFLVSSDSGNHPCLEESGLLFVFDKGTLTAFDTRTGNVRWRVPSVGISRVLRDSRGMLYVVTTSASPDSIQYSQQIRVADKPYPVILKVDSSSGKVLWKSEKLGESCYLSDKYLYVTSAQISGLDVMRAGGDDSDVPTHFRIYRLNPGNGNYIWEFYDQSAPKRIEVQKNRLLLQYPKEIRVLTYRTM